jgi:hypothetical protein
MSTDNCKAQCTNLARSQKNSTALLSLCLTTRRHNNMRVCPLTKRRTYGHVSLNYAFPFKSLTRHGVTHRRVVPCQRHHNFVLCADVDGTSHRNHFALSSRQLILMYVTNKTLFELYLQLLLGSFYSPINIEHVMLQMHVRTYVST